MEYNGYFNISDRSLYGRLFAPEGTVRGSVTFVSPFGEEKKCAFRLLVRLARELVVNGIGVLLFDLSGTGESSGTHADATWEQWLEDTIAAADLTVREIGEAPHWFLGARLGALLAATAAKKTRSSLILLEPTVSGEDFLRDLERRQMIKSMMLKGDGQDTDSPDALWERGECADFGGFQVSRQLAEGMQAAELISLLQPQDVNAGIHLIRVSGGKKWPPAWTPLVDLATQSPGGSAVIVKDKPFWGQLEYYESSAIIDHVLSCLTGVISEE